MAKPAQGHAQRHNEDAEIVKQAIIVADSFNYKFQPLTANTPRCLLPVCNIPLIDYAIEAVSTAGIEELFIICCANFEKIKQHITDSKWSKQSSLLPRITVIVSEEMLSMGDALREMDAKQLIHGDFVLLSSDVITNTKLATLLAKHTANKLADKNCIMTMGMSRRCEKAVYGDEATLLTDASNRLIQYTPSQTAAKQSYLTVDLDSITLTSTPQQTNTAVSLRANLIDVCIDVCSLEVLALFTENFDYQDMKKDFVKGMLESDILGKTIYVNVFGKGEYAGRVKNTRGYEKVSHDLMNQLAFPVTPHAATPDYYTKRGQNGYIGHIKIHRSATVGAALVIGSGTTIAASTTIRNSVLGEGCTIGSSCKIESAYLWESVSVGNGCVLQSCIIADGCVVGDGCVVNKGVIIGYGVVVPANTCIPAHSKIRAPFSIDQLTPSPNNDLSSTDLLNQTFESLAVDPSKHISAMNDLETSDEDESEDEVEESEEAKQASNINHYSTLTSQGCKMEIHASLDRALSDSLTIENAALELNTLKMSFNCTFGDLREVLVPKLVDVVGCDVSLVKTIFGKWSKLLVKLIFARIDQLHCIETLAHALEQRPNQSHLFTKIVFLWYDEDVIEESVFLEWFGKVKGVARYEALIKIITPFCEWLMNAEEEE